MDALVVRLEDLAARRPRAYTILAVAVALLGVAILFVALGLALSSVGLLIGAIAYVIGSGGKGAVIIFHAGKLLLFLGVPAWVMVKASVTVLFTRFPEPEGRELTPDEAPALFAAIGRLRRKLNGPPVHKVILSDELNASIVQHPRFGLFGWERNYLFVGLPLLEVLSEEEALSVLAHEYGHLSGHHGRLGGFIYRFRLSWGRLQSVSERWRDWGSRLVARLLRWYAPYFDAYTFVLARQNEYLADRTAVEVAGRRNAAAALMRVNIAGIFHDAEFWPSVWRRADDEPEPPPGWSLLWREAVGAAFSEPRRSASVEQARRRKTDGLNTHPALTDRLAAMGMADDDALTRLEATQRSAASGWLAPSLERLQAEFDKRWRDAASENWRARHAHACALRERLAMLEALPTLTTDQQWERVTAIQELRPESDVMPALDVILTADPNHLSARFLRGIIALEQGDDAGVADLESVMAADPEAVMPACNALWRFYDGRDVERARAYRERWRARAALLERVSAKSEEPATDAVVAPADLEPTTIEHVAAIVREHKRHIRRAYLMRRTLAVEAGIHDYVLAFEARGLTAPGKTAEVGEELAGKLAKISVPLRIVALDGRALRRFRKHLRKSGVEPLPFD